MPHISQAMVWSKRRSIGDIFIGSLLSRRGIADEVSSVKNSFSSWDNCMQASYCKWPVIAIIIIGGLILLSILTCIVRCCCCGYSCCCACFSCLKCCDCCGDSCEGKRNKPMKHRDDDFGPPPPEQGYRAEPMMGGGLPTSAKPFSASTLKPEPPQYAQFEVGKSGLAVNPKPTISEDALPPMPSWDAAANKHVETDEEKNAIELKELSNATPIDQKMPLMAGASAPGTSPVLGHGESPYGARPGQGAINGYFGVPGQQDANGQNQQMRNGNPRGLNGSPAPGNMGPNRGFNGSPAPGGPMGPNRGFNASPAPRLGPDRRGPNRGYNNSPQGMNASGQVYGGSSPQDQYANNGFGVAPVSGRGPPQRQYSDSQSQYSQGGRLPPQRQFSNDQYGKGGQRGYPPQPQRQYSNEAAEPLNPQDDYPSRYGSPANNFPAGMQQPRGPSRGPGLQGPNRMNAASPAISNSGGFDFNGSGAPPSRYQTPQPQQPQQYGAQQGYRGSPNPQQMSYGSSNPPARGNSDDDYFGNARATPAPTYRTTASPPPQEAPAVAAYPGYRPYQAPSTSTTAIPAGLTPGGAREPPRWDPVHQ